MLCERGAAERVAVEVVDGDDLVVVDEPPRERRADESGAARDDDALSAQSHAGECSDVAVFVLRLQRGVPCAAMRAVLDARGTCAVLVACSSAAGGHRPADTSLRISFWEDGDRRHARRPCGRFAATRRAARSPGRRAHATRLEAGGAKLFAPLPDEHRVHRDLRRPATRSRRRDGRRTRRVWATFSRTNGCNIDRWQRRLAVAPASGRRDASTRLASPRVATVLFVGAGRHQRRAIEQARARGLARGCGRPQRRRAGSRVGRRSRRSSTSRASPR